MGDASLRQDLQRDLQIGRRQQPGGLFRPLDQADVAAIEFVAETGGFPLGFILESVQVEVAQV